jgi:predicted transcriptional regulator
VSQWENFHTADPLVWCRALRDVPVSPMAKLVGHVLAMHINVGSGKARVGVMKLAYETGTSKRTAIRSLQELERIGLIHVWQRGSNTGRAAKASEYSLTTHDGLERIRTAASKQVPA